MTLANFLLFIFKETPFAYNVQKIIHSFMVVLIPYEIVVGELWKE